MQKRSSIDATGQIPFSNSDGTTEENMPAVTGEDKNPAAVALGRLGGLKGGRARANKLTADERSEIAKRAAAARWSKRHDS
jgi:hypothetical protein